ncbi:exodeoxyribonuclease V subunit gamma [Williamsia sterculiae]|uniref:RecBCD enzyme subunit RecC n=1 Tax=Williamsia sterculiae TaxID=1344003 RepID=A0A1N7H2E5_9NOCA|nr:exodeoxyribonuclease V subunit gamma [Williamsia sterculiae]SIS19005.1 DNA helicase/exodeoxyribonuclease V, gamma subunit [Williamsia sterculiae]
MFILHRAERTDTLVDVLAEVVADPLEDPFAPEVVAVPARGVERWLRQSLATRLGVPQGNVSGAGVAANIDFPSPVELTDRITAELRGFTTSDRPDGTADPWTGTALLWQVLAAIDRVAGDPQCAVLARHIGRRPDGGADPRRSGRRFATAARLATVFRGYAAQRPAMLVDWAAGFDGDGLGGELDPDLRWQPHLWRSIRTATGVPSPAEELDALCERLILTPEAVSLPARLAVFGPTRLAVEQLRILDAVGAHRDVHLLIPHPSDALWRSVDADIARLTGDGVAVGSMRRKDFRTSPVAHPLLAGLSRDVRELQARLSGLIDRDHHHATVEHATATSGGGVLHRLQDGLRRDDPQPVDTATAPDTTLGVHACHGPDRQVQVMRERLLRLFADDPTLEPRDVIIMCPDVETYAPLIRAAFGAPSAKHPGHAVRVRLADRDLRQTNAILDVVATVVRLATARVTATELLDLAGREPVRHRFGFTDDDLQTMTDWVAETNIRWALDDVQRRSHGLPGFPQNTVDTGLDRVLLGVSADETELAWLGLALPLDDVESTDIDLAGRFAEFVARLQHLVAVLRGVQPVADWAGHLEQVVGELTDTTRDDSWQRAQAFRSITALTEHAGPDLLSHADVVAMTDRMVAARPTRANFRTGELTVCTMVPMRSVPHRAVMLLGLDDDVYPRSTRLDGDDVTGRTPCVGERDPRSEDRQLLLDAVMSATEHLSIYYTGADPVSGLRRPPAVPVSELIDAVTPLLEPGTALTRRHPLHDFDADNFRADSPLAVSGESFSFDTAALAGARAVVRPPVRAARVQLGGLSAAPEGDVDLADLVAFVEHPVKAFFRQRAELTISERDDDIADDLDVDLDGLAKWQIGERILRARIAGAEPGTLRAAEFRRGTLPPFGFGLETMNAIDADVDRLMREVTPRLTEPVTSIDISLGLPGGRRLSGTVPSVFGGTIVTATYSRLGPVHRLAAWVRLLAVAASGRVSNPSAVAVGRGRYGSGTSTLTAPDDPLDILAGLVGLRDRGLRAPLPVATKATALYATRRRQGVDEHPALSTAGDEFSGRYGEHGDRYLRFAFPGGFDDLTSFPAADGPVLADVTAEHTEFGAVAGALWNRLLDDEKVRGS